MPPKGNQGFPNLGALSDALPDSNKKKNQAKEGSGEHNPDANKGSFDAPPTNEPRSPCCCTGLSALSLLLPSRPLARAAAGALVNDPRVISALEVRGVGI